MAGSGTAHLREDGDVVMRVVDLVVEFPTSDPASKVQAVSSVSIDIMRGETLGLVGESGCGKSTTAKALVGLVKAKRGEVWFDGKELTALSGREMRRERARMQLIFQDPIGSLFPRHNVRQLVQEPLEIWSVGDDASRRERVDNMLDSVGIDPAAMGDRRPGEMSGGQCQRVSIARALINDPQLVICDEPVSALDVSVQAQILNLLEDIKDRYGLTLLFVSHDLAVVKNVSDRVCVMYLGKICEVAPADNLYRSPAHPYTLLLLSALPDLDPDRRKTRDRAPIGDIPSNVDPPSGCRFRTRCLRATEVCANVEPEVREIAPEHFVACHHPHDLT
jgi:peptide/nickel transport system ATP-binding protein